MPEIEISDLTAMKLERWRVPALNEPWDRVVRRVLETANGRVNGASEQSVDLRPPASTGKKERTLYTLLRNSVVKPGDRFVLATKILAAPIQWPPDDPRLRCVLDDEPRQQRNVVWEFDGKPYSLSALTAKLRDEHGLPISQGGLNGYACWSLESMPGETLWDLAHDGDGLAA